MAKKFLLPAAVAAAKVVEFAKSERYERFEVILEVTEVAHNGNHMLSISNESILANEKLQEFLSDEEGIRMQPLLKGQFPKAFIDILRDKGFKTNVYVGTFEEKINRVGTGINIRAVKIDDVDYRAMQNNIRRIGRSMNDILEIESQGNVSAKTTSWINNLENMFKVGGPAIQKTGGTDNGYKAPDAIEPTPEQLAELAKMQKAEDKAAGKANRTPVKLTLADLD